MKVPTEEDLLQPCSLSDLFLCILFCCIRVLPSFLLSYLIRFILIILINPFLYFSTSFFCICRSTVNQKSDFAGAFRHSSVDPVLRFHRKTPLRNRKSNFLGLSSSLLGYFPHYGLERTFDHLYGLALPISEVFRPQKLPQR